MFVGRQKSPLPEDDLIQSAGYSEGELVGALDDAAADMRRQLAHGTHRRKRSSRVTPEGEAPQPPRPP